MRTLEELEKENNILQDYLNGFVYGHKSYEEMLVDNEVLREAVNKKMMGVIESAICTVCGKDLHLPVTPGYQNTIKCLECKKENT